MNRLRTRGWLAAMALGCCGLGMSRACAAVYYTEAEHLILLGTADAAYTCNYKSARAGKSVYLRLSTLRWDVELPAGTFRLWLRARLRMPAGESAAWLQARLAALLTLAQGVEPP